MRKLNDLMKKGRRGGRIWTGQVGGCGGRKERWSVDGWSARKSLRGNDPSSIFYGCELCKE